MGDNGYALNLLSPVRHVATKMAGAAGAALSIEEMAATYQHSIPGDLARIRMHEQCADDDKATIWLIQRAVEAITRRGKSGKVQVEPHEGGYRLVVPFDELRYGGRKLKRARDDHAQFRDPFNPMSGKFSENIRLGPDRDDLSELRESMRAFGWIPQLRAIRDKRTGVVLAGHRRLKVAAELGLTPVYEDVPLGDGDEADAKRLAIAIASNTGAKTLTPENRKRIAEYLHVEGGWTMARIAEALEVSQPTISNDLASVLGPNTEAAHGGRSQTVVTPELQAEIQALRSAGQSISSSRLAEKHGISRSTVERVDRAERARLEERERTQPTPAEPAPDVKAELTPEPPTVEAPMHACPHCGAMHPVTGS